MASWNGGRLDREVEGLPETAAMRERAPAAQGLTRPELAVLLAYAKLDLNGRSSPPPARRSLLEDG